MSLAKSLNSLSPFSPLLLALLGAYTLIVSHGIGRFLYTANLPTMLTQTELTTVVSGYVASANYAGYLAGAILAMLVSVLSVQVGMVLSIITAFVMAVESLALWYVARFLAGVASALVLVNGSTLILSQFPARTRTVYTALYFAGVGFGVVVSSAVVYAISQTTTGYADMWLLGGSISLPTLWIAWQFRQLSLSKQAPQAHHLHAHAQRDRQLIIASYALGGFGYITAATFLPVIVVESLGTGVSEQPVDLIIWAVVGLAAMLSNPVWGRLAQHYHEVTMLLLAIITQILSLLIPVYFASVPMLFVAALLFGGSFMAIVSLSMGAVKHLSAKRINFFLGLATVCYSVGQILGPLVTVHLSAKRSRLMRGYWSPWGCMWCRCCVSCLCYTGCFVRHNLSPSTQRLTMNCRKHHPD